MNISATDPGARRLRVLFIDCSVGFGGSTISLGMLMQALDDVDSIVLTCQTPEMYGPWFGDVPVHPLRQRVNYRSLGMLRERIRARFGQSLRTRFLEKGVAAGDLLLTWWNALRIALLIRRRRLDLVHMNNGFTPQEGLLGARLAGVPCFVHMRGILRTPTAPRSRPEARRWIAGAIAISEAVADSLAAVGIPEDLITLVHNSVDPDRFAPDPAARRRVRETYGIPDEHIVFGAFGRVIPWKGQQLFLEAMLEVMRADERVRAMIVGDPSDGERGYYDELVRMAEGSGLDERITFTGFQPKVEEFYAAVDVVVHSATVPEPFGRVLVEAMATGCTLIASGEGGPLDVVEDGTTGLLFTPRDRKSLEAAVDQLASDDALRLRLATAGREAALRRFGPGVAASQVRELYQRALETPRAAEAR